MADPLIIMSAPNGARRQKTDHPALPVSPAELAACALEVAEAGASILHLHVRDDSGAHTLDVARYRAAMAAVEAAVGKALVIQATTESVGLYSRFEQMDMVRALRPEAVSLALRELCPDDRALGDMERFAGWMSGAGIMPQYILYDMADYQRFVRYVNKGVFLCDAPFALFVIGRDKDGTPEQQQMMAAMTKAPGPWAVCGFGQQEADMIGHAASHGGHIRVGFENNIQTADGTLLTSHAQMIEVCVKAAHRHARPVASADDVRNLFIQGA